MDLLYQGKKVLQFTILGNPIGQGRPRMTTRGGHARAYDPKGSADEKAKASLVAQQAVEQNNWVMPSNDMPVSIVIVAYLPIPNSKQRWFKEAADMGIISPLGKPDADNIAKLYMDAMSGIVYADDKQVFDLHAIKKYSNMPRIEVTVTGYYLNIGDLKAKATAHKKSRELEENDD